MSSKKTQNCIFLGLFRPVEILGLRENERIFGQLKVLRWPLDRSGRSKKRLYPPWTPFLLLRTAGFEPFVPQSGGTPLRLNHARPLGWVANNSNI